MRIRTTTGPGASPPLGLNKSSNGHNYRRRIGGGVLGVSVASGCVGTRPQSPLASIMEITSVGCGGDQR
jgi:hypothetical protein